jgi:AraC-like DNA-binding protein
MAAEFLYVSDATASDPRPNGRRVVLSSFGRGDLPVDSAGLSIKYVADGEEVYEIDGRRYRLLAGDFIIVDAGATGRVVLPRREPTIGLCAFLSSPPARPLVPGYGPVLRPPPTGRLAQLLRKASLDALKAPGAANAEDLLLLLSAELGALAADTSVRLDSLDAAKPSTRVDLLMRLEKARAHLHDSVDRAVALDELARVAGLSGFHLTRHFAAAYGEPPARYHRRLRLERAAELLRRGEISPTGAAERFGYADLPAFTRAFRSAFGHPPSRIAR